MIKKCTLFCILFLSFFAAYCQSTTTDPKIAEVYGSYVSRLSTAQINSLHENLQRSEVKQMPYSAGETLPKLSSLKVITKYVPSLQMESVFDPAHINPLKYAIDYYSNKDQTFRIDGTDYVLLIKKKI